MARALLFVTVNVVIGAVRQKLTAKGQVFFGNIYCPIEQQTSRHFDRLRDRNFPTPVAEPVEASDVTVFISIRA